MADATDYSQLPDGPTIKGKLSRDDIMMRGGMLVIALYHVGVSTICHAVEVVFHLSVRAVPI